MCLAERKGHSTWSDLDSGAIVVMSTQVQHGSAGVRTGVSTGVTESGIAVAGIGAGVSGCAGSGGGMGWSLVGGTMTSGGVGVSVGGARVSGSMGGSSVESHPGVAIGAANNTEVGVGVGMNLVQA